MSLILALPLAFAAGLLTILSPCILPLAPIVVASARAKDARGPLALAVGLALTFALVGGGLGAFGIEFGALTGLRVLSAAIMVALGLVLLIPSLAERLETRLAGLGGVSQRLSDRLPNSGVIGNVAAGSVLALAWAPCAGPTLGAAFALAADGRSIAGAMLTMLFYALGAASSLLLMGLGLGRLTGGARSWALLAGERGQFALGATLSVFGALILTGLDHNVEAAMISAMPNWLAGAAAAL